MVKMTQPWRKILDDGVFYLPASRHYGNNSVVVVCDYCNTNITGGCIGYGDSDLCMACTRTLSEKLEHRTPTSVVQIPNIDNDWVMNRTRDVYAEADQLEKEGHTCIQILESYPPQLSWCKLRPCKNGTVGGLPNLIGLTENRAMILCRDSGLECRTATRDGAHFIMTADYRKNRANLTVTQGYVSKVTWG